MLYLIDKPLADVALRTAETDDDAVLVLIQDGVVLDPDLDAPTYAVARDVDVRGIGLSSITAVVEFRDSTASPTEYYKLSMDLKRGWESPLWSEIDGEGGTPTGLADLLEPVASESAFDPGEDQGLRKRSEL